MMNLESEERKIQLLDLYHFVECCKEDIIDVKFTDSLMHILEKRNNYKIGLQFYYKGQANALQSNKLSTFFSEIEINEFWFVYVEEDIVTNHEDKIVFINDNQLRNHFTKCFVFNFFQSQIIPI